MIAIAEQRASAIVPRNFIRFLGKRTDTSTTSESAQGICVLHPQHTVYGKLNALLCASLLVLCSVHNVWLHTLSVAEGMSKIKNRT